MKRTYTLKVAACLLTMCAAAAGCTGFLDRGNLTQPTNETYLSTEGQVQSYVDGMYISLPVLTQYGTGVRSVEKNSDNIVSEQYDPRINGENNAFSGTTVWETAYQNLRDANYFFSYYMVPKDLETPNVKSLYGEVLFFRAWWHFSLLKNFGNVPVMDGFWDGNATTAGLQMTPRGRKQVAEFILSDLETAVELLHGRQRYSGLRINKEAALVLAMNVALYEGSWEKYHAGGLFAAKDADPDAFFSKVMEYGDRLFSLLPVESGLNTKDNDPFGAVTGGEAFAHLFNKKDLAKVPEALFWKKYDVAQGVQHSLTVLLGAGAVDGDAAAGLTKSLVDNYLNADGTFIVPSDPKYKDFNETFRGRDPRLLETVMSTGHKFRSTSITKPMKVAEYDAEDESINPPRMAGDGKYRNLTGYHTALGTDTTYVAETFWDTGLVLVRYAEALLAYAEAAEELGLCDDAVLAKTIRPLRERAGVSWVEPVIDPSFTNYGYPLTPNMQEIRRERRSELALQGFRLDDILRWKGHQVIVGQRGKGAYLGKDGVLYRSFDPDDPAVMETIDNIPVDENGWADPLSGRLPSGYAFRPDRDYLLPVSPEDIALNRKLSQNPNW